MNLNQLVPAGSGWNLHTANGINAKEIVGQGTLNGITQVTDGAIQVRGHIQQAQTVISLRRITRVEKLAVERMVREFGGTILRPGLVFGPNAGGAFGNLYQQVCRGPFLPVINIRIARIRACGVCTPTERGRGIMAKNGALGNSAAKAAAFQISSSGAPRSITAASTSGTAGL